ncbi:hypothetical protein PV05_03950 [Exophiala xenobiotica]|uniref:Uncharacterized protein n=1 Tax=Exophiala xenobiotica TaxID=348802 RepID=A0A0D2C3Z5_9EURO|nr:uncharacterized protein PV05_03950 [Exophiala xenobiotica]KIW59506.1 hypothetical protein PV05_03950 [Exophiala xenobiotica]
MQLNLENSGNDAFGGTATQEKHTAPQAHQHQHHHKHKHKHAPTHKRPSTRDQYSLLSLTSACFKKSLFEASFPKECARRRPPATNTSFSPSIRPQTESRRARSTNPSKRAPTPSLAARRWPTSRGL